MSRRVEQGQQSFDYVYQYRDHLTNESKACLCTKFASEALNVMSYKRNPNHDWLDLLDQNHYYPFGLRHEGYNFTITPNPSLGFTKNHYKYNNKELQTELNLNLYDYGARNYDPTIGRWFSVDPLAEKYRRCSPYNYVMNNPIRNIDPDGRGVLTDYYNTNGKKIGTDGVDNGVKIVVTDNKEARTISSTRGNIDVNNVKSGQTLPSNATLKESLNVLTRTIENGGKKEESSLVMNDGKVVKGKQGGEVKYGVDESANAKLPDLPAGTTIEDVEASIHSHPTKVEIVDDKVYSGDASVPSTADSKVFAQFGTNIIVGPLGQASASTGINSSTGKMETRITAKPNGVVIYTGSNTTPTLSLTEKSVKNILKN